jgi:hypothetical protein
LNVHGVDGVRQTEKHTDEQLETDLNTFEVEWAIKKIKSHRSPGIDQNKAELVKEGVKKFATRSINLFFSIWSKE